MDYMQRLSREVDCILKELKEIRKNIVAARKSIQRMEGAAEAMEETEDEDPQSSLPF